MTKNYNYKGDDIVVTTEVSEATRDCAICVLKIEIPGKGVTYLTGHSRRDPDDKPNPQLGMKLAYQRALESFVKALDKQTKGMIKHADDMREYKKKQKESAAEPVTKREFKVGDIVRVLPHKHGYDISCDLTNQLGTVEKVYRSTVYVRIDGYQKTFGSDQLELA